MMVEIASPHVYPEVVHHWVAISNALVTRHALDEY